MKQPSSSESRWQTATIREQYGVYPSYEVALEFPLFGGTDSDIADLNVMLRSDALQWLVDIRTLRLTVEEEKRTSFNGSSSELTSSYEVSCYSETVISIRYSVFHYGAGAAHPNHWTKVKNVQLGPLIPLHFADLFAPDAPYLKVVSDYCISHLSKEKGLSEPSDWILEGAGPDAKNFSHFNITLDGLFISFDEYQVDCYAAGPSNVLVARNLLREYLNPRCHVTRLWTE